MHFEAEGWSAFDDLADELERVRSARVDLSAARPAVVQAVQEGNRRDRLAGIDKSGNALVPIAESTRRTRDGDGPPLAAHGEAARAVDTLVVDLQCEPGRAVVALAWHGAPWLRYHAQGAGRLPVRDILGIPHSAVSTVDQIIVAEADRQMAEAASGRGFFSRIFGRG